MALTGKQRQFLRALAHHRKPVVQIGTAGISEAVLGKVHAELVIHELIKVKVSKEATITVADAAAALATGTHAELAQIIGRTAVLFRGRKKKPGIRLPVGEASEPESSAPAEPASSGAEDLDEDEE